MHKKIVYIDMDGVLVDLEGYINSKYPASYINEIGIGAIVDMDKDLFYDAKPIEGAIEAFKKLSEHYEVYVLSTAPWDNIEAMAGKRLWVEKHLGEAAYKRLILSHNKHLMIGDYLIDDRTANGAGEFKGELIQFGNNEFPNWNVILKYLEIDGTK